MTNQYSLLTIEEAVEVAPIQKVSQDDINAGIRRMRVLLPDIQDNSMLAQIAQESILYRTVPNRDAHYFVKAGKLSKILDYKYVKNWANFKEQDMSGDLTAAVEDTYRPMTADDKITHGVEEHWIGSFCRIVTPRERKRFADEVRVWIEMGFKPDEAVAMAKSILGELGHTAVGIVDPTAKTSNNKPVTPPFGWSFMQWAEKLAFKNAVMRKYGIPTADESQAMAIKMARRALPEDWQGDFMDQIEIQARRAQLEAQVREGNTASEGMTLDEHKERLAKNVTLLHGDEDDTPIGEEIIEGELGKPWQVVTGDTPDEIVTNAYILWTEIPMDKQPNVTKWLVGPEIGVAEADAVCWFLYHLDRVAELGIAEANREFGMDIPVNADPDVVKESLRAMALDRIPHD